jgi:hypothetical protein
VRREELAELHYITPIVNIPSICQRGVLSHCRAQEIEHETVAMKEIQDRRAKVVIPNGRPLHEYANLYICARNPMMYKRRHRHAVLCVLRISTELLDLSGVVISDGNAASKYVRFAPAPDGLAIVNRVLTFAENWNHENPIQKYQGASAKGAEVLVPDFIPPKFLMGIYVSCDKALAQFNALGVKLQAEINGHLFFQ